MLILTCLRFVMISTLDIIYIYILTCYIDVQDGSMSLMHNVRQNDYC